MPLYTFVCPECNTVEDKLIKNYELSVKMIENKEVKCQNCGAQMEKGIQAFANTPAKWITGPLY